MSLNKYVYSVGRTEEEVKVLPLVSCLKSWGGEGCLKHRTGNTAPPRADQCLSHVLLRHILSFSLMSYKMV